MEKRGTVDRLQSKRLATDVEKKNGADHARLLADPTLVLDLVPGLN
jgi:hypothetical protein